MKTKATHTPGPWEVGTRIDMRSNPVGLQIWAKNPLSETGMGRNLIASSPDRYSPEAEANAHLIAAAPELLEIARKIKRGMESGTSADHSPEYSMSPQEAALYRELKAIIRKAEGRE